MTTKLALIATVFLFGMCIGGSCPGVCQPTSSHCPNAYKADLCPGPANIECCPEATPDCTGQCQSNSLPCGGSYKAGLCPGPDNIQCCEQGTTTTTKHAPITRATVLSRAAEWTAAKIPYCQCSGGPPTECCGTCPYCSDYRCDCSGYVSFCWNLGTGYTTSTLPQVSHPIQKDQLLPADAMLNQGDHVVLFAGWADADNKTYYAIQEPGCHNNGPHYAYKSVVDYPFSCPTCGTTFDTAFIPYRFNHIEN